MPDFFDRVKVETATVGQGPIALGAAPASFRDFIAAGTPDGAAVRYLIEDAGEAEIGIGVYDLDTNTLSRSIDDVGSWSSTSELLDLSGAAVVMVVAASADLTALRNLLVTTSEFSMLAAEGELDPGQAYLLGDLEKLRIALGGSTYLEVDTAKVYAPVTLLSNGNLDDAGPPPDIVGGGGTATLVIDTAHHKLTFNGGTLGSTLKGRFDLLGLTPGGYYQVAYEASDQLLGCTPIIFLGGSAVVGGGGVSGAPGEHAYSFIAGVTDDALEFRFTPNFAGRRLSISKARLFKALRDLDLSAHSVDEGTAADTVVAAIQNRWAGSTLTIVGGNTGGTFRIDGDNLVVNVSPDYDLATPSFNLQVTEELHGAAGSPHTTILGVAINDLPSLLPLTLDAGTIFGPFPVAAGTWSSTVGNVTAGSVVELIDDCGGRFTYDAGTNTLSNLIDIEDDAVDLFAGFRESAAGVDNSPRETTVPILRG
ncbi:MAG: hypothetical protein ACJ8DZ_14120 [Allosphingosinicella sp.]